MSEEKKPYYLYWGKLDRKSYATGTADFHLLPYHCLDVAAVAYRYLQARPELVQSMADFLGMHTDDLIRLFVLLVVFHDLGKFASAFQGLNTYSDKRLWPGKSKYPYDAAHAHHDRLGSCFWEALKDDFLGLFHDSESLNPREQRKAQRSLWVLMECSLGHHGRPIAPDMGADALASRYTHPHDFEAASLFMQDVCRIGDLSPAGLSAQLWTDEERKGRLRQLSWSLAGIVVLADWLGSNRDYFPYDTEPMPLETYWTGALVKAQHALTQTEMAQAPVVSAFQSIERHFQFAPSPLQDWAQKVPVDDSPQLFILGVPRASGDEPPNSNEFSPFFSVFPAQAGMNRPAAASWWPPFRVPRASGDEPARESALTNFNKCSPRRRG